VRAGSSRCASASAAAAGRLVPGDRPGHGPDRGPQPVAAAPGEVGGQRGTFRLRVGGPPQERAQQALRGMADTGLVFEHRQLGAHVGELDAGVEGPGKPVQALLKRARHLRHLRSQRVRLPRLVGIRVLQLGFELVLDVPVPGVFDPPVEEIALRHESPFARLRCDRAAAYAQARGRISR
jgi:hypothetical protein